MHVFLFGTTVAFARYAGGLFHVRNEPITVTLVGNNGSSVTDGGPRKTVTASFSGTEQHALATVREQALENVSRSALQDDDLSVRQQNISTSAHQDAQGNVEGIEKGQGSNNSQAAGSPNGSLSSEQWAVIVSSLERAKSYPRLARERGIEGVVHLRFHVRSQGEVDHVEVVRSSGYEILDTASVRTVYRAAPLSTVSGWVEVPIAYMLK